MSCIALLFLIQPSLEGDIVVIKRYSGRRASHPKAENGKPLLDRAVSHKVRRVSACTLVLDSFVIGHSRICQEHCKSAPIISIAPSDLPVSDLPVRDEPIIGQCSSSPPPLKTPMERDVEILEGQLCANQQQLSREKELREEAERELWTIKEEMLQLKEERDQTVEVLFRCGLRGRSKVISHGQKLQDEEERQEVNRRRAFLLEEEVRILKQSLKQSVVDNHER